MYKVEIFYVLTLFLNGKSKKEVITISFIYVFVFFPFSLISRNLPTFDLIFIYEKPSYFD